MGSRPSGVGALGHPAQWFSNRIECPAANPRRGIFLVFERRPLPNCESRDKYWPIDTGTRGVLLYAHISIADQPCQSRRYNSPSIWE